MPDIFRTLQTGNMCDTCKTRNGPDGRCKACSDRYDRECAESNRRFMSLYNRRERTHDYRRTH